MKAFIDNPNLLIKFFNQIVVISQKKAFITVGIEIQKDEINTIEQYRAQLNEFKKEYVKRDLENEANLVYCIENSLKTIQNELKMLVNIKEDKMNEAWNNLVDAQITFGTVVCCRIITEMVLEECSLVENPANKRCRALTIRHNGKTVDVMTLREVDKADNNSTNADNENWECDNDSRTCLETKNKKTNRKYAKI